MIFLIIIILFLILIFCTGSAKTNMNLKDHHNYKDPENAPPKPKPPGGIRKSAGWLKRD